MSATIATVNRRAALLDAWADYDADPTKRARSLRFEVQCSMYARELGTDSTRLRAALVERRRAGMSRAAALADVEGPL